jgi:DNA-binding response OmpR family regulator
MDGRTMARIWKEDDSLNKIPIVALTAEMRDTNSDSDDLFSDYLTKPVSGIDLYRAIAKFVSPDSDINLSNTGNKTIIIKLDDNIIDEIKEKNLYGIVQESIKIVNTKELRYLITELQTISD